MESTSKVALVYCENYEYENVSAAVKRGLDLIGGAGQFAHSGEKILIKPNLLVGEPPENAINPHPSVFKAVLEQFIETGAELCYGDSPAIGSTQIAARLSGLQKIADDLDIPLADFKSTQTVSFPEGNLIKQFTLVKEVLEADGLISLCKLKSHALTRITGAIKNQFGCIPGLVKSEFHTRFPNSSVFSQMLVDLNLLIKPRLFIMDGIVAMEGNGPRNGTPKSMKVILFSSDPVALDTVVCRMVNLDESLVETIKYGKMFGLGNTEVEIIGDQIGRFYAPDFKVNRGTVGAIMDSGPLLTGFVRNYISPRPTINVQLCKICGKCEEICPAQPKALSWANGKKSPPVYNYGKCIRCFCCQELCPHNAISVKTPFLGKIIHR